MIDEDFAALGREELEARIVDVQEELDDIAAERALTLGGTGVHIGAKEAERMRNGFERDEARLRDRLDRLQAALRASGC